jgi:translation initiation factor IF-3
VEILLGPKRKGKKATEQEANAVMQAVKDAVAECKGASEVKSEGTVGGVLTIVFEGRKIEEKKEPAKAEDDPAP